MENCERKNWKIWKFWKVLVCFGLLGLFQITMERLLRCSKAISGRDGMGLGMGWKSLYAMSIYAVLII